MTLLASDYEYITTIHTLIKIKPIATYQKKGALKGLILIRQPSL